MKVLPVRFATAAINSSTGTLPLRAVAGLSLCPTAQGAAMNVASVTAATMPVQIRSVIGRTPLFVDRVRARRQPGNPFYTC
jgi:hypothetical protein